MAVRALTYCAIDPRFETHFELSVGRSLTVHPAANGDLVETLGRKRRRGKDMVTIPHKADGSGQISSLAGTPQQTNR